MTLLLRALRLASPLLAITSGGIRVEAAGASAGVAQLKSLSLADLLRVEVTSVSRFAQPLMDATANVQVITNEDLRRTAGATVAESLRLADNLNVAQKNPHDWAVSARGFNANVGDKMLVLMDGRSVYTPLFAGVFWNVQDYLLEDVDHIEAISGPGGTLWGANAVNGVINITTKSARDTQGAYLEAAAGSWLHHAFGVRYGGALAPQVFYRVYGKFLSQGASRLEAGTRAADDWEQGQFGFRIDATPEARRTLTIQGDGYSGNLGIQTGGVARIAGGNLLARWSQFDASGSGDRIQVYVDRTHLADPFGASPFAPAGYLRDDLDTYDFEYQRTWATGRHRLMGGGGYRHIVDHIREAAPNFGFRPAHDVKHLANVFLQDEIGVTDRLALILGAKLEHNGYTGWETEPNVRLRWHFASQQMLWAAVSRAVRTPSRFDRDVAQPFVVPALIQGGKNFDSETLVAYELGYRARIGRRTDLSLSFFYHEYDRLRGLAVTPVTLIPLVYANTTDGETHGAELSLEYRPANWWRLTAGFALLREHLHVKPGQTDFFNTLDETQDPTEQASLRSSMDLFHGIQFDVRYRWVSRLIVNQGGQPGSVPAYGELDLRINYPLSPSLELSLVGQNLLDASHPEYGPAGPSREEIRRNIFGKLSWRF